MNQRASLIMLHRLSKSYGAPSNGVRRPDWLQTMRDEMIASYVPEVKTVLRGMLTNICDQDLALPQTRDTHGLLHADSVDGNFTIDYTNGQLTVFDFDDCAYGPFLYDLPSDLEDEISFMGFFDPVYSPDAPFCLA